MRAPWLQISMEVLELVAPNVAVLTNRSELETLGSLTKFIGWALGRCPEERPPSAGGLVTGAMAAKLIAAGSHFPGNPHELVEAYVQVHPPLLERQADGFRIRGLRRYDGFWAKSYPAHAKAWKAAHPEWRPPRVKEVAKEDVDPASEPKPPRTGEDSEPNRSRNTAVSPPQDPDQEEERERKKEPPPQANGGGGGDPVALLEPPLRERWEIIQEVRRGHGLNRERAPPPHLAKWSTDCDSAGVDNAQIRYAAQMFMRDTTFSERQWPTAVFIHPNVFDLRVPMHHPEAH